MSIYRNSVVMKCTVSARQLQAIPAGVRAQMKSSFQYTIQVQVQVLCLSDYEGVRIEMDTV